MRRNVNGEIEVEETSLEVAGDWVIEMGNELDELARRRSEESGRWKAASIYRIPWSLKKLQRKAYQPQMVSMGPYHHGELQLRGMDEHKKRALLTFLERSGKTLRDYVDALAPLEQDLKDAYPQLQPHFKKPDSGGFLRMMILDGCFMLELIRTTTPKPKATGYEVNDPIFSKHGALYFGPLLKRDMLMLENQLPLRLLVQLVEAEGGGVGKHEELSKRIFQFLDRPRRVEKLENCLHVLDLYRKNLLMPETTRKLPPPLAGNYDCGEKDCNIRSATELTEAGVRFKRLKPDQLDNISFEGGVLQLPRLTVDDTSEYLYLNLMAFERFHEAAGNDVTSYVFFMDRLIDSAKDVGLLHWGGVLQNSLGSDQDVADLFNSLSTDVCLDPDGWLFRVQMKVADYYRKPLPRLIAYAKHNYFANPWVTLSIVAAIFLFALTITQTVYALLDYYKK